MDTCPVRFRVLLVGVVVFLAMAVSACGGSGDSSSTTATNPAAQPAAGNETTPTGLDNRTGSARGTGRAALCFTPQALKIDAGESFSGIKPGSSFPGQERIIKRAIHFAVVPTVLAELRSAERGANLGTTSKVRRVRRAANRGLRQILRDPNLFVRGRVPGFNRAQALVDRYNVGCAS
jgi:hypothetical protein